MIRDSPELAGMYFAATSSAGTYRMRRPDGEFVAFSAAGGGLVSDEGWTGKFDGDLVRISKSQGSEGKDIELTFRRGALSRVSSGGIGDDVEFSSPIVYEGQAPAKLWCFQQSNDRGGRCGSVAIGFGSGTSRLTSSARCWCLSFLSLCGAASVHEWDWPGGFCADWQCAVG